MLIGDNQQQQVQLAKAEGALQRLLELRLQKDDEDCKQIADGVVAAMVSYAFFSGSVDTVCGRHVADPVNRTFVCDQACLQVRCWQVLRAHLSQELVCEFVKTRSWLALCS